MLAAVERYYAGQLPEKRPRERKRSPSRSPVRSHFVGPGGAMFDKPYERPLAAAQAEIGVREDGSAKVRPIDDMSASGNEQTHVAFTKGVLFACAWQASTMPQESEKN